MELDYTGILLRWLHIFAAIALVGGTMFQRFALVGPAAELPSEARTRLLDAVRRRWSKVVMLAILFLLVSGAISAVKTMPALNTPPFDPNKYPELNLPRPAYGILLGIKMLLALAIFFIASVLSGSRQGTARFRQNAARWLSVNLVLAILVVGIAGVLRSFHTGPNDERVQKVLANPEQSSEAPAYEPRLP